MTSSWLLSNKQLPFFNFRKQDFNDKKCSNCSIYWMTQDLCAAPKDQHAHVAHVGTATWKWAIKQLTWDGKDWNRDEGETGDKRYWAARSELQKMRGGCCHEKASCTESANGLQEKIPLVFLHSRNGRTLQLHHVNSSVSHFFHPNVLQVFFIHNLNQFALYLLPQNWSSKLLLKYTAMLPFNVKYPF